MKTLPPASASVSLRPSAGSRKGLRCSLDGDTIGKVAERDLRTGPDMVIVVGTGLKMPRVRRLVKEFCRGVNSRGGLAVWINKDPVHI